MLQFNFKIAHIAVSFDAVADFFPEWNSVKENMRFKTQEDIKTTPIEVTTSSSDVADGEQIFFTQADNKDESLNKPLNRKNNPDKMRSTG